MSISPSSVGRLPPLPAPSEPLAKHLIDSGDLFKRGDGPVDVDTPGLGSELEVAQSRRQVDRQLDRLGTASYC